MFSRSVIRLLVTLAYGLARRLYRVEVDGLENLPRRGPAIIALDEISNMGSLFLTLLIYYRGLHGMMDLPLGLGFEDIWMEGPMRLLYEGSGSAALRPGKGQPAGVLLLALRHLEAGGLVMINPAGEVSFDGTFVPPQRGAAWLALRSGAPLVPLVASKGAYDIWPMWADRPSLRGRFSVRAGRLFRLAEAPQRAPDDAMVEAANRALSEAMQALIANPTPRSPGAGAWA